MSPRNRSETACFNPRDYQVELLDKACKSNIIVQLGTGSGKTFIAVLLLKEYGVQLFAPIDNGGKRGFFIVDKVSLVEQQAVHIESHTKFKVGRIHGQLNADILTSKSAWQKFMKEHHVVVITAQCLLDCLRHALFNLGDTCVLIFDECHHALGSKHPYHLIMNEYRSLKKQNEGQAKIHLPRVLGLTASLIKEKTPPSKLEEKLNKLESIMDSSIETASDIVTLSKYGAKPYEGVVYCKKFEPDQSLDIKRVVNTVLSVLDNTEKFIGNSAEFNPDLDMDVRKNIREGIKTTRAVLKQLGPYSTWKAAQTWERKFTQSVNTQSLPDKAILFLNIGRTTMITIKRLLEPKMKPIRSLEALAQYTPHKFMRLFQTFEMFTPLYQETRMGSTKPERLSAIVFVDQRYIAYALNALIKSVRSWDSKYKFIMSDYVVGASGNAISNNDNQALHKRQSEVLRKFHKNELNVLIATSVLEEGVDVKQCNVVLKFDRPLDMRSYVQSKGRARRTGSRYLVLVEETDIENFNNDLQDFKKIEKLLLSRFRTVNNPLDDDSFDGLDDIDSLFAPYVVESTGASVMMSNAIQLVNRYCGKLPSDIFTRLTPQNRIIPVEDNGVTKYCAELYLPINSPIKNAIVLQNAMPNKKCAQMAVALEACRQLHQKGELDDHLMPKGRESIAKLMEHIDDEPDEYSPGCFYAKVGSSKRKQLYDKKIARALNESLIEEGKPCYVYVMNLHKVNEPDIYSNPKNRSFADPILASSCFGFLSSKKIPKLPSFPVFLRQGHMVVNLILAPSMVTISEQEMNHIKQFHDYIFTQVLQMCKTGNLVFDMTAATPVNTLIVPLLKNDSTTENSYRINMEYVSQVVANMGVMPRIPDVETRKNYKFNPLDYKDAIVMPWYRNVDQPAFYYVANVLDNMNPESAFPDENFKSFNEYFNIKYKIQIFDQNQSLLDVDFTSNRLNLLQPRVIAGRRRTLSASSRTVSETDLKESAAKASSPTPLHPSQRQILVPELMDIHPISATLWNVIAALPSIFYRVNQLLLSDELRQTILIKAFGKSKEEVAVTDNLEWPCLTYPYASEEKESVIVKKIQHLAELNRRSIDKGDSDKDKKSDSSNPDNSFTIDCWDPQDAIDMGYTVQMRDHSEGIEEMDETEGLTSGLHDGNISDEDDDDLAHIIVHDLKSANIPTIPETESIELWPSRPEIVESGWGDLDDDNAESTPFQIIEDGRTTGLNVQSLMEDIGRHMNSVPLDDNIRTSSVSADRAEPMDTSAPVDYEKLADLMQQEKLLKAKILEDEKEAADDGRDKPRKVEEIVDLIALDNDENVTYDEVKKLTADEEIQELMNGEIDKKNCDEKAVQIETISRQEFEVLTKSDKPQKFSFAKESPNLAGIQEVVSDISHIDNEVGFGVSPCLLLTALTTSNASDGMSLERFETIGDSFLKYAVTDYLYHTHLEQHEGKLSFARSKEVSNCNLYRLGKKLGVPQLIVASKFDAHDSWLPPCYVPTCDFKAPNNEDAEERDIEMERMLSGQTIEVKEVEPTGWDEGGEQMKTTADGIETITFVKQQKPSANDEISPLPYNLLTQQNISDKSIADAMEALIGVHLLTLGPNPTLKVMKWMGLKVVDDEAKRSVQHPLLRFIDTPANPNASTKALNNIWQQFQFEQLENTIGYRFKERAYLVQAFTHASYTNNRITGCYQRLEFLGDAVLDYMITRYLFEDSRQYSPGVLTDLRSALVNNTIFASLAIKYEFQKHFIAMCPGLHHMIEKFVKLCSERSFDTNFHTEMYMATTEEEIDEGQEEDIEVPKAMGDIFESVAGAIYLDCGRNLDKTWTVIYGLMKTTIEECCNNPPRSPIRELMELESSKARFSKMERILESGKVRVTVDVGNNMRFTGMGRNYRIAKSTAAKRALRYLHQIEEQKRSNPKK